MNDDYKIVEISYYRGRNEEGVYFRDRCVTVYSLRNNNLREVVKAPNDHAECLTGLYLNGSLHWLCSRYSDSSWFIAAFNLQNEEFEEVQVPSFHGDKIDWSTDILDVVLNGSLCLCARNLPDVWVMKEYGVIKSWKKFSIYGLRTCLVTPLCFMGDQQIVLDADLYEVIVYNVEEKTSRYVRDMWSS